MKTTKCKNKFLLCAERRVLVAVETGVLCSIFHLEMSSEGEVRIHPSQSLNTSKECSSPQLLLQSGGRSWCLQKAIRMGGTCPKPPDGLTWGSGAVACYIPRISEMVQSWERQKQSRFHSVLHFISISSATGLSPEAPSQTFLGSTPLVRAWK